jgi:hypothetical protein
MSNFSIDTAPRSATPPTGYWTLDPAVIGQTLEISEARTYDAALDTLDVYKLTGNFPVDLEIVLKDLRVLDKVSFEIKPKTLLSDTRHVQFRPAGKVRPDEFADVLRSVANRIGADSARPWWVRLFQ